MLGRPLSARRVTAVETDPMRDELPTQRIARLSNRLRDEHMLRRLIDALAGHERVFATVGVIARRDAGAGATGGAAGAGRTAKPPKNAMRCARPKRHENPPDRFCFLPRMRLSL